MVVSTIHGKEKYVNNIVNAPLVSNYPKNNVYQCYDQRVFVTGELPFDGGRSHTRTDPFQLALTMYVLSGDTTTLHTPSL